MALPATLDGSQPLDDSYGLVLVGILFSAILHGLCIMQAITYFRESKRDSWIIKAMVLATVAFDDMHLILISAGIYHYLIRSFHHPERLEYLQWTELIQVICVGLNAAIVQGFYTYRIFRLSKRNYMLCGLIILLIIGEVAAGLTWVVMTMRMETWRQLLGVTPVAIAIDGLACSIDIIIAGSLIYILNRSKTGFKRSDTLINKLIVFVINTGILTTIFSVSSLIAVAVASEKMVYAMIYFSIGRLYTNSFLTTLNSRSTISNMVDMELQSGTYLTPPSSVLSGNMRNLNILVETTTQEAVHRSEKSVTFLGSRSGQDHDERNPSPSHKTLSTKEPEHSW